MSYTKLDQKSLGSSDGIALIMIQNYYLLGFVFASSALIYSCSITSVGEGRKWN